MPYEFKLSENSFDGAEKRLAAGTHSRFNHFLEKIF